MFNKHKKYFDRMKTHPGDFKFNDLYFWHKNEEMLDGVHIYSPLLYEKRNLKFNLIEKIIFYFRLKKFLKDDCKFHYEKLFRETNE